MNRPKLHRKYLKRRTVFRDRETNVLDLLLRWTKPTAIFGLIYVALAIGIHSWRVGFLPRFSQTEIISDALWIVSVGFFGVTFGAFVLFAAPLFVAQFLTGSAQKTGKKAGDKLRSGKLTDSQLRLFGLLVFGVAPLYGLVQAPYVNSDLRDGAAMYIVPMYLLVLGHILVHQDPIEISNPFGKPLTSFSHPKELKTSIALSISWSVLIQEIVLLLPRLIPIGFAVLGSYAVIGVFGAALIYPIVISWSTFGFAVGVLVAMANITNLLWFYRDGDSLLSVVQITNFIVGVALLLSSVPLVIYFSRIGNLSYATAVFDSKYAQVVSRLTPVANAGDAIGTAEVDVVLAFGGDVVLAAPGSFLANSACQFSWLQNRLASTSVSTVKEEKVKCIALPRSAVYSIL